MRKMRQPSAFVRHLPPFEPAATAVERETIRIGKNKVHHGRLARSCSRRMKAARRSLVYRNIMSTRHFETQYQQNPITRRRRRHARLGYIQTCDHEVTRDMFRQVVQSWDTAWSEELRSDFSVCTTWAIARMAGICLICFRGRLSYNALKHQILHERSVGARQDPDRACRSGVSLLTELRREEKLPGGMLVAMRPVNNKEVSFCRPVSTYYRRQLLPSSRGALARRVPQGVPAVSRRQALRLGRQPVAVMTYLGERRAAGLMRNGQRPPARSAFSATGQGGVKWRGGGDCYPKEKARFRSRSEPFLVPRHQAMEAGAEIGGAGQPSCSGRASRRGCRRRRQIAVHHPRRRSLQPARMKRP